MSSGLRVTQRSMSQNALANLQSNLARLGRIQEQMSSGRSLVRPSDSPTGTVSALRLRSDVRRSDQLLRNAADGIGWLGTADTTLSDGLALVRRTRELALSGVNAALGQSGREALAAEVDVLRQGMLAVANTKYLDQPIFGGTAGIGVAYDASGAYQGDTGTIARTVAPGVKVQVSLTGEDVFGPNGTDLFTVMADIANHLRTDPTQLTATDLTNLDAAFLRIQNSLATVGSRYHQVEIMQSRTESNQLDGKNQLSEVEGVDLAESTVQLQLAEVAYQAALAATARVITPSLVDFLR